MYLVVKNIKHVNQVNKIIYTVEELHLCTFYTGEDLKPTVVGDKVASRIPCGVLCFKSLPIPRHWRIKMSHFNSSMV